VKTIKKYSNGGVTPSEPLTEEEKKIVKDLFGGDVKAYLRSKEMTRVLEDYERRERLKKLSELPSVDDASKLSDVKNPK
jgi:hypothetical protein|tara:strand:- start:172 stop:408 length:237 start_codon:yes stop_codon:yes gene_type:complete